RKCLARLFSLRRAQAIRRVGASARGRDFRGALPGGGEAVAGKHREKCVGRPVVSARLFRQRRAARLEDKPRMPDRFAAAKLVGDQRRRRSPTLASSHERRRSAPYSSRIKTYSAFRSAL